MWARIMSKRTTVPQPLSASGLAALDQVAAALDLAHAEACAREEAVPAWPAAVSLGEWPNLLAGMDDKESGMVRHQDHVTHQMEHFASFLESEELVCGDRRAELQACREKLGRLAAHSLS